jgi:hypothetical protein
VPATDEPTLIFIINNSLNSPSPSEQDIYQATRCAWRIGEDRRDRAVYALGVSNGVVRGAYRIHRWYPVDNGRWCFDGHPVPELNIVGTSASRIKPPQGNASPVRFFPDGIPPLVPDDQ